MAEEQKEEKVVEEERVAETSDVSKPPADNKKLVISIGIVLILIVGALEMSGTTNLFGGSAVATVNGEKITQAEYDERINQIFQSEQAQLMNLEDPALRASIEEQILNEIINTRLLIEEAKSAGNTATEAEVETEYQLILERLGSELNTPEEKAAILAEELAANGLTDSEFRQNIADQIVIEQYFNSTIDESSLTVTDDEIELYHSQLSEAQPDVPPLDEISAEIESQIVSQKRQQAVGQIILNLRESAEIVIAE